MNELIDNQYICRRALVSLYNKLLGFYQNGFNYRLGVRKKIETMFRRNPSYARL